MPRSLPGLHQRSRNSFAFAGLAHERARTVLTSITMAPKPAAPFFEMIDATIKESLQTVAVASLHRIELLVSRRDLCCLSVHGKTDRLKRHAKFF
jgi:hypothetical protein